MVVRMLLAKQRTMQPSGTRLYKLVIYLIEFFTRVVIFSLATLISLSSQGHGSVTADEDLCVINIDYFRAHFKIYQLDETGREEFCEDIPGTGKTLFVMEYLHDLLGDAPIEMRIMRNPTSLGAFTNMSDLPEFGDLDSFTVLRSQPVVHQDVFMLEYDFLQTGDYIGLVTVQPKDTEVSYMAMFPFHVGSYSLNWLWLLLVALGLTQFLFWFLHRQREIVPKSLAIAFILLIPCTLSNIPKSDAAEVVITNMNVQGKYIVQMEALSESPVINKIQTWRITVKDREQQPVVGAELLLNGGMPKHNHGLATVPEAVETEIPGEYLVRGLRFHMQGEWVLDLVIKKSGISEQVQLILNL
jgi:hypothetical protein